MVSLVTLGTLAQAQEAGESRIAGRGATFPNPLYQEMFDQYQNHSGVIVSYEAVGSGTGIKSILAQEVDFGASDRFLTDEQLAEAVPSPHTGEANRIFHIPMALAAVVPVYNFSPFHQTKGLVLEGKTLADIFRGEIRVWNHPDIVALNPNVDLPNMPITVVHRAEGSGTTAIFTDYLGKESEEWRRLFGAGGRTFLDWTVGIAGEGNSGIAEVVSRTPGSIGYVVYSTAQKSGLPIASMKNKSGEIVSPTLEAVSLASEVNLPDDLRVSLTDTANPQGWPIVGFTYLLIYQDQNYAGRSIGDAQALKQLVLWMLSEGQNYNEGLGYGRVADAAKAKAQALLDSIVYSSVQTQE